MKLIEALNQRRAVRSFLPDAMQPGVLKELVDAACLAPSHMNMQPWSFAVVANPDVVARLGRQATASERKSMDEGALYYMSQDIQSPEFDVFYKAPALIVVCATQPGSLADMDCAMAAHSLMLAATTMGLGTCWVSFAQPWLASPEGRKQLGLDADERPVAPIIVGGPAGAPLSPGRFKPRLHWVGS